MWRWPTGASLQKSDLKTLNPYRSHYISHRDVSGVEQNTGALRHRLVVAVGTAVGRGVSVMENVTKLHHRVPNDDELNRATVEVEAAEAAAA